MVDDRQSSQGGPGDEGEQLGGAAGREHWSFSFRVTQPFRVASRGLTQRASPRLRADERKSGTARNAVSRKRGAPRGVRDHE